MRYRDGLAALTGGTPGGASRWRYFPWMLGAAMFLVIAINIGMVLIALRTFPGQAGSDGFDLSNQYDHLLSRVQQQSLLGWSVRAETDPAGHPVVVLKDKTGAVLTNATLRAKAERPVGTASAMLTFNETAPGRYTAKEALDLPGQWDLLITATRADATFTTTRRIITQ